MQEAIELVLAHGWPDDGVDALVRCLTDKNMEAAMVLARTHDMPGPARTRLTTLITSVVES